MHKQIKKKDFISAVSSEYVIQLHLCKGLQNSDFGVFKVDKRYVLFKEILSFFVFIILQKSCSYKVISAILYFFFPSIEIRGSPNTHPPDKCSLLSFLVPTFTALQRL